MLPPVATNPAGLGPIQARGDPEGVGVLLQEPEEGPRVRRTRPRAPPGGAPSPWCGIRSRGLPSASARETSTLPPPRSAIIQRPRREVHAARHRPVDEAGLLRAADDLQVAGPCLAGPAREEGLPVGALPHGARGHGPTPRDTQLPHDAGVIPSGPSRQPSRDPLERAAVQEDAVSQAHGAPVGPRSR